MNTDAPKQQNTTELNSWVFDLIRPFIKGRTLEIGSGHGRLHQFFVNSNLPIHLSDVDESRCESLRQTYLDTVTIRGVHNLDFTAPAFEKENSIMKDAFDTVLSLNPARETFIDQTGIFNTKHLLRTRGHFILLVSANVIFYPGIDPDWNDLKIKNRPFIKKILNDDFDILKIKYFDLDRFGESPSFDPINPVAIIVGKKK